MKKFKNDKNNFIIAGLLTIILLMVVVYAAFATQLNIKGNALISSTWNVQVTDIAVKEKIGSAEDDEKVTSYNNENGLTAIFKADLSTPGDSITYDVTIKNLGTLDAILEKITTSTQTESDVITFDVSGIKKDDILKSQETTHLFVKITFKDIAEGQGQPTTTASDLKVILDYVQYANANGGSVTPTPTGIAYHIGDQLTLQDNTEWVVVENSSEENETVRIMSKHNIAPNLVLSETNLGTALFKSNDYGIAFDTNGSTDYTETSTKNYLENIVEPLIAKSLDIDNSNSLNIGIWGYEELTNLGCSVDLNTMIKVQPLADSITCDNTFAWYNYVFQNTNSWLNLGWDSWDVWYVDNTGNLSNAISTNSSTYGVRPIITVSKDKIKI